MRASLRGRLSFECISMFVIRDVRSWADSSKTGSGGKRMHLGCWARSLTSGIGAVDGLSEPVFRSALPSGGRVRNVLSNKEGDRQGRG